MDFQVVKLSEMAEHGRAFFDYLALRKQYFVDALGWEVSNADGFEMDQYDTLQARYVIVRDAGKVVAGARCLPKSASWAGSTYMLGDACAGKLPGLPANLIAPEDIPEDSLECTRLVIAPSLTDPGARVQALRLICAGLVDIAEREGAGVLIALSNFWLLRALRRLGYAASLLGQPYTCTEDGHRYAVMQMRAERLQVADALQPAPGLAVAA